MKAKLEESRLKLEWVERLDLTTHLEGIVANIMEGKEKVEPQYKVETPGDQVVDDLQRETVFYRQAQAAIIEGLSRLKAMNIPTKRPEDYFAQMAKSDDHMLKVSFSLSLPPDFSPLLFISYHIGEKKSLGSTTLSREIPESKEIERREEIRKEGTN